MKLPAIRFPKLAPALALAAMSALPLHAKVDFEKQVLPFLKERCFDCHQAPRTENGKLKKPKADLRLDDPVEFMKGGENGVVVTPKSSSKSPIFESVTLPKDDDKHMPPKGDPLAPAEIALLGDAIFAWNFLNCQQDPDKGSNTDDQKGSYYFTRGIDDWNFYGKPRHFDGINFVYDGRPGCVHLDLADYGQGVLCQQGRRTE